nr:uncharacterized protein LOC105863362 isoform X4 [Microcebus murinus]
MIYGTLEAHRTFAICPRPERENKDLGRLPTCATGPSPDAALLSSTLPHGASGLDALAHSAQTCQEPTYHAKPWIQGKCSSAKKCEVPSSPLKEERKTKSQNEQMASQYSPSCHLYLMKRKSYRQVSSTGQRKKGQSHQQLQANSIPAHWPEVKGFFSSQVHMGWEGTLGKLDDVHPPYPQRKTCSEFYYNTQAFCFHTSFQH